MNQTTISKMTEGTLKIQQMDRTELIHALRSVAHPSKYHEIIAWPTEAIRQYLIYQHCQRFEALHPDAK